MKNLVMILVVVVFSSCGFQYASFNSEENKIKAEHIGNDYFKARNNNNKFSDFKLISVENAIVYVGKNRDTIKEVYEMIYQAKTNNVKDEFLVKIKKKGSNIKVKLKNIN